MHDASPRAVTAQASPRAVTARDRPLPGPRGSEYAVLLREMKQAGLLERRPRYYAWKITLTGFLLAAGWSVFVLVGDSWWQLAVAVFLAVMFAQVGFLGHDAGHRQILGTRRGNYVLGVLHGNLGVGLSYGWWVTKHSRHHAHPNTEGADPDVMLSVVAFTTEQARRGRGLTRLLFRYQAVLLLPMLLLEAVSLHVASIRALATRATPGRAWEIVALTLHLAGYLTLVLLVLPPSKAAAFIAVQQGLFGMYLGCSFAPNHKGMPVLSRGEDTSYLRRQVITSRNVRGGWLTDLALGGLNYQIEHHLFPSMPRPNLRRCQVLTQAFCRQQGIPYCETTLPGSYGQVLRHLAAVGRSTRAAARCTQP